MDGVGVGCLTPAPQTGDAVELQRLAVAASVDTTLLAAASKQAGERNYEQPDWPARELVARWASGLKSN